MDTFNEGEYSLIPLCGSVHRPCVLVGLVVDYGGHAARPSPACEVGPTRCSASPVGGPSQSLKQQIVQTARQQRGS